MRGWKAATEAQQNAIDSEADMLLFGGSAGSLKTETLLVDAAMEHENPNLRGIIFRNSFSEMQDLIDKTQRLYGDVGAEWKADPKKSRWEFPSGATIRFAYMAKDADVWKYLGPRYSFIGFDESTLHSEKQVRNIMGRLSSTDRRLRLRLRLTSNPGNIGAAWHMKLFLRGHCPVHAPTESAKPGKLYKDCKWSDGEPIPFSVAFIPGKLSDHNLLDADYSKRLHMMAGASAAAMELGCWCALEGAYFSFLNKSHVTLLADAGVEWWHNHFLSLDYGYGKSSSSVGLYVRGPAEQKQKRLQIPGIDPKLLAQAEAPAFEEGRIRKIGELVAPHVPAYELANLVIDSFVRPESGMPRRRIIAAYLDPANFKDIGDGHTIADQINEVFEPWDIVCERASNDRVGGWQLLYRMLKTGQFEITDVCPQTFDSLTTRMHHRILTGDVAKVAGDPLDDVADETRYAIYTFIQESTKPRSIIEREAMKGLDPKSAMIRWQQLQDRLNAEERPPHMAGRHQRMLQ